MAPGTRSHSEEHAMEHVLSVLDDPIYGILFQLV